MKFEIQHTFGYRTLTNDLADLSMKAFLDRKINRNTLARVLVYVSHPHKNIKLIHLLNRDGTENLEGTQEFQRQIESYDEFEVKYKKFLSTLIPEEDVVFSSSVTQTAVHPALQVRFTGLQLEKGFSVESNGVFYFSHSIRVVQCDPRIK